jgi:hypothetical protein
MQGGLSTMPLGSPGRDEAGWSPQRVVRSPERRDLRRFLRLRRAFSPSTGIWMRMRGPGLVLSLRTAIDGPKNERPASGRGARAGAGVDAGDVAAAGDTVRGAVLVTSSPISLIPFAHESSAVPPPGVEEHGVRHALGTDRQRLS